MLSIYLRLGLLPYMYRTYLSKQLLAANLCVGGGQRARTEVINFEGFFYRDQYNLFSLYSVE